jgi:tetratricopeptide (TPR) repeat protein
MRHRTFPARGAVLLFVACFCSSCVSLGPGRVAERGDPDLLELSEAAHLAYDHGDLPRALALYGQALDRARLTNEPQAIVDAACSLAICHIAQKRYRTADVLLREAAYDAERGHLDAAEIMLLRAKVAYLEGDFSRCVTLADKVSGPETDELVRLGALILRGQALCGIPDLAAAKAQWRSIEKLSEARAGAAPSIRADTLKLRGTIAGMEHQPGQAASLFDQEAALLRISRRYTDIGPALARAAECYEAAGRPDLAADRFYLAARNTAAQGDAGAARRLLASSVSASERTGDEAARLRATGLLEEINERGGP